MPLPCYNIEISFLGFAVKETNDSLIGELIRRIDLSLDEDNIEITALSQEVDSLRKELADLRLTTSQLQKELELTTSQLHELESEIQSQYLISKAQLRLLSAAEKNQLKSFSLLAGELLRP